MLRKKEAKYLEFTFKNDNYGRLFEEANENLQFDTYISKLQESIK